MNWCNKGEARNKIRDEYASLDGNPHFKQANWLSETELRFKLYDILIKMLKISYSSLIGSGAQSNFFLSLYQQLN